MRAFNAAAVMLGFASHLVLDEIWSVDLRHFRLKSSFGTAVKLWGSCWWSNALAYLNVAILALVIFEDPTTVPTHPLPTPTRKSRPPWRKSRGRVGFDRRRTRRRSSRLARLRLAAKAFDGDLRIWALV